MTVEVLADVHEVAISVGNDDDANTLATLVAMLSPEFDVVVARNGRGALRLVRRDPPDLVMLDMGMPDLGGLAVCRSLQADPGDTSRAGGLFTASGGESNEVEGLAAGASDFITKPPRAAVVRARVRKLVRMKRMAESLWHGAHIDALTGLSNRSHLMPTLALELQRAWRQYQPLSLLMIDVDHFKVYNDHYGHLSGDGALRQLAQVLQATLRRAGDLAGRLGGEEFVILLPATDAAGARRVGQSVADLLAERQLPHAASPTAAWVSVSIGWPLFKRPLSLKT